MVTGYGGTVFPINKMCYIFLTLDLILNGCFPVLHFLWENWVPNIYNVINDALLSMKCLPYFYLSTNKTGGK